MGACCHHRGTVPLSSAEDLPNIIGITSVFYSIRVLQYIDPCPRSYDHRPSYLHNVGKEHIGFYPTTNREAP